MHFEVQQIALFLSAKVEMSGVTRAGFMKILHESPRLTQNFQNLSYVLVVGMEIALNKATGSDF